MNEERQKADRASAEPKEKLDGIDDHCEEP